MGFRSRVLMTEIYNLWVSSGKCLIGLLLLPLVVLTACLGVFRVLICPLNDVWLSCRHLLVHCMHPKRVLYRPPFHLLLIEQCRGHSSFHATIFCLLHVPPPVLLLIRCVRGVFAPVT